MQVDHQTASDMRSAAILGSARQAFAEKGFDGASMQDLARKAGMSVGNFYRYFPSKAALVEALIAQDLAEIEQNFAEILRHDEPLAALRHTIALRITDPTCENDGQLWAEITAAALRKPEIGLLTVKMEQAVVGHLLAIFGHVAGVDPATARHKWQAEGKLIVLLVKACSMQHFANDGNNELQTLVLRVIDRIIDEIAHPLAKG